MIRMVVYLRSNEKKRLNKQPRNNNACAIHGNPCWSPVPNIFGEAAVIFDDALARRK